MGASKRVGPWGGDWSGPEWVALTLENVSAAVAKCPIYGVKRLIEQTGTRPFWMAWITDTNGNRICLRSPKDGTSG
jgi:hypothetical protein